MDRWKTIAKNLEDELRFFWLIKLYTFVIDLKASLEKKSSLTKNRKVRQKFVKFYNWIISFNE